MQASTVNPVMCGHGRAPKSSTFPAEHSTGREICEQQTCPGREAGEYNFYLLNRLPGFNGIVKKYHENLAKRQSAESIDGCYAWRDRLQQLTRSLHPGGIGCIFTESLSAINMSPRKFPKQGTRKGNWHPGMTSSGNLMTPVMSSATIFDLGGFFIPLRYIQYAPCRTNGF